MSEHSDDLQYLYAKVTIVPGENLTIRVPTPPDSIRDLLNAIGEEKARFLECERAWFGYGRPVEWQPCWIAVAHIAQVVVLEGSDVPS